jgi:RNA polymerase sigma-70 factor (ECF subfamily)
MIQDKQTIADELLYLRCRRGDMQAWDALIQRWQPALLYYLRRLVASEEDAWDVLQQVWVRALRGIGSLGDARRLPAWLYKVARCTALSHWRGYYRSQARLDGYAAAADHRDETAVSGDFDRFDDAEQVHRGLEKISPAHRDVLTLFFLQDLSLEEMAEVLEVPLGTAKSRLHYAKQALRAVLESQEETP